MNAMVAYWVNELKDTLESHLRVCNFRAATDEDCDVCAWAKDMLAHIPPQLLAGELNEN